MPSHRPAPALRILRVVREYWPHWGGNERWSFEHDRWFSECAGDEVTVLVLRQNYPDHPAGRELADRKLKLPGRFRIPELPRVSAYHDLFPETRGAGLIADLHRLIRPWVSRVDVVITQLTNYHTYLCWRKRPVVLEPGWPLACTFGYRTPGCHRTPIMCRRCLAERGWRWWVKDQLRIRMLQRFDLIVGTEVVTEDLIRHGITSKVYVLRHIVNRDGMYGALDSTALREQKAKVDELARKYRFVLMQFNRLADIKNPELLLEVAESLPEVGVVYAGDGLERGALEARVSASAHLRGRVCFLGQVPATHIGTIAEGVSAFVMTGRTSNYNTALCETMALDRPVVAIDTSDFPPEFQREELIVRGPAEPRELATEIRDLLNDANRCASMATRAGDYIERHHSPERMWAYRERLVQLVQGYGGPRNGSN